MPRNFFRKIKPLTITRTNCTPLCFTLALLAGPENDEERRFQTGPFVVDDDLNVVAALQRGFHRFGAIVTTATDGLSCIKIALERWNRGQLFQAIILDLRMPGLDGFAVCRTLRTKGYPGLIISLSGEIQEFGEIASCLLTHKC